MRFVGVGALCCERRRRRIGRRSITDRPGRWTVSTIEPVTIQAAGLARRPVPLRDKGTPA
jgi:hypothetical protein